MEKTLFKKGCLVLPLASLFLVACSNSNTGCTEADVSENCTINITGTIEYERVPFNTTTNGLDYDNIEDLPVRGATLQALDEDGDVVAATTTSSTGHLFCYCS